MSVLMSFTTYDGYKLSCKGYANWYPVTCVGWMINCELQSSLSLKWLNSEYWGKAMIALKVDSYRVTNIRGLFNTLTPKQMDAISQTTFSNAFSWMKMFEFRLKFHWSLFLRFQLTIFQHWFRYWLGAVQATSHYLNKWCLVYWRVYASLGLNELTKWY